MNGKGKGEEEVQEEKGHRVREDIFLKNSGTKVRSLSTKEASAHQGTWKITGTGGHWRATPKTDPS